MRPSPVTEKPRERTRMRRAVAVGVSALAIATLSVGLSAQEADDLLGPFTPDELTNNWSPDRTDPTGGVESVTFGGRDDVARIGIDSSQTNVDSPFFRTEGIQSNVTGNGDAVQVDLFIDPAWQDNATRAGLWVFDQGPGPGGGAAYGIIEFANIVVDATTTFEGFRVWDANGPVAWIYLDVPVTYGDWVTFRIEVDPNEPVYRYLINGDEVEVVDKGASAEITQVILNSYNFGLDFEGDLTTVSYDAHWSETPQAPPPTTTTTTQPGATTTQPGPTTTQPGPTTTQPPPPPPTFTPPVIPPENLSAGREDPGGTVTARGGATPLPGQLVTISLSGCAPDEFVYLRLFPGPVNLGWHQADASGQVVVYARIPANYQIGEHHVVGHCESGTVTWAAFEIVGSGFVDVPSGSPFELAIAWMERVGITQGCNPPANTMYCPTADTTRGQMAGFFTRALNLPPAGDQGFTDTANSVFVNAINSIAVEGITLGCNPPANDRYCPDDVTSRGQMAGFFTRALNLPPAGDQGFTDIAGSVFVNAINSIAAEGITRGCNPPANDNYCPVDPILRQQMAAFFVRAYLSGEFYGLTPR